MQIIVHGYRIIIWTLVLSIFFKLVFRKTIVTDIVSSLVTAVCIPGLIPPLHCSASPVIFFCYCRVVKQTKNFSSKCSDWQSWTVAVQRPTTKLSFFPFLRSLEEETSVGQRERRRHKQRHRETDRDWLKSTEKKKINPWQHCDVAMFTPSDYRVFLTYAVFFDKHSSSSTAQSSSRLMKKIHILQ